MFFRDCIFDLNAIYLIFIKLLYFIYGNAVFITIEIVKLLENIN